MHDRLLLQMMLVLREHNQSYIIIESVTKHTLPFPYFQSPHVLLRLASQVIILFIFLSKLIAPPTTAPPPSLQERKERGVSDTPKQLDGSVERYSANKTLLSMVKSMLQTSLNQLWFFD